MEKNLRVVSPPAWPEDKLFRYLDTVGDGNGTKNANGNYSVTSDDFKITPPAGERYAISRMIVEVEDTSGMQAEEYGNLGAALTNGIQVLVVDDGDTTILDLTDGEAIKTNAGWGSHCYDVALKSWGAGDELLLARWTFARTGSRLLLESGYSLLVRLNDDFTGLVGHYFFVNGIRYDKGTWN